MTNEATLAEADRLLRSGKLYPLQKSLLRSAFERAKAGDFAGLADRIADCVDRVARQDAVNEAEAIRLESERSRLVSNAIRQYGSQSRVRRELELIEISRNKRAERMECLGWGLSYEPAQNEMERREILIRALAILEKGAVA